MDAPMMGSAGRALTAVAPTGQVEVNGLAYLAETSMFGADPKRPPIPVGQGVIVAGWRADHQHGVILVVRDPTAPEVEQSPDDAPAAATPAPMLPPVPSYQAVQQEERIRSLERQLADRPKPGNALGTIVLFTVFGLVAGVVFSFVTYSGQGLIINPCAFALWAGGGALIGVIVHLIRGSRGGGSY